MKQNYIIFGVILLIAMVAVVVFSSWFGGAEIGYGPSDGTVPDINRTLPSTPNLDATIRTGVEERINEMKALIKENPDQLDPWIELGLQWKVLGDIEGTRQAWEYASFIRPNNSLSFGNLGHLYAHELNDLVLAESNYKTAIANDPTLEYMYGQIFELYHYLLKDDAKARAVLEEGLKHVESKENLFALIAQLEDGE